MRRILLVIMVIVLGASTACSSALSLGQKTSDNAHAFLIHSAQIIDKIDGDIPPEGEVYFVIKYEVQNLQNQNDSPRQWTDQIILEATSNGTKYSPKPVLVESLDNQLWETSLLPNENEAGYIVFIVPEDADDFNLTVTLPDSRSEVSYELRPKDKRTMGHNVRTLWTPSTNIPHQL